MEQRNQISENDFFRIISQIKEPFAVLSENWPANFPDGNSYIVSIFLGTSLNFRSTKLNLDSREINILANSL